MEIVLTFLSCISGFGISVWPAQGRGSPFSEWGLCRRRLSALVEHPRIHACGSCSPHPDVLGSNPNSDLCDARQVSKPPSEPVNSPAGLNTFALQGGHCSSEDGHKVPESKAWHVTQALVSKSKKHCPGSWVQTHLWASFQCSLGVFNDKGVGLGPTPFPLQ